MKVNLNKNKILQSCRGRVSQCFHSFHSFHSFVGAVRVRAAVRRVLAGHRRLFRPSARSLSRIGGRQNALVPASQSGQRRTASHQLVTAGSGTAAAADDNGKFRLDVQSVRGTGRSPDGPGGRHPRPVRSPAVHFKEETSR